jgi:hypothetical protein
LQARHDQLYQDERAHHTEARTELAKVSKEILGKVESQGGQIQTELVDTKLQLEGVRVQQVALRERIALLEALLTTPPKNVTATPTVESPGSGEVAGPVSPAVGPPVPDDAPDNLIADVADSDPARRYSAILALQTYSGPKVLEALAGCVTDPEEHIRIAVIESLRLQKSPTVVPQVFQALRDKEYLVRLYGARAIRELTGNGLPFNPDGSALEREKQVKAWEAWWKDKGPELIAAAAGK